MRMISEQKISASTRKEKMLGAGVSGPPRPPGHGTKIETWHRSESIIVCCLKEFRWTRKISTLVIFL